MAKIVKNSLGNFLVIFVIFSLVVGWIFSGWPRIWPLGKLGVNTIWIPPEIQEAQAATATNSPTTNTGSAWTNPNNAYADDASYANITAGNPSGSNVWGNYGFSLTGSTITQVRVRYDAWSVGGITFVNAGAEGSAASGNITLGAPASPQNYDVWIAVVHSSDNVAHSFTDWTQVFQANGGSTATRLSVWYFRYAGSAPNLIVTHASGQSPIGGILAFRGVITSGSPIDVVGVGGGGTDASIEIAGVTTNVDGAMLVAIDGAADDNNRSPLPTGFAAGLEDTGGGTQNSYHTIAGAPDGSVAGHYKIQASAGPSGNFTDTQAASDPWASVLIALKLAPLDDQIRVDVSWDGGSSWSATQNTTLTSAEATTWYDVTALAGGWTPAKLADGQLQVRALAQSVNNAEVVRLDWLPVEVTYTPVYSVSISDGNVTYGTLNVNTSRSTLPGEENEMQTVTNEGSTSKINIKGTVSSPGGWTLGGAAAPNVYVHQFCNDTDNDCTTPPTNYTALTTGYTQLKASVANAGTVDFQLRITTPTSISSYVEQDVDVWVQATAP